MSVQQTDIFRDDHQQQYFAELCSALYERELSMMANSTSNDFDAFKRRLGGLSYHIRNLAHFLLQHKAPLDLDLHNASWQCKQAAKSIINRESEDKARQWFEQYSYFGMPVAVCISEPGYDQLELDSVDRIDPAQKRLHINKHGWFYFNGESQHITKPVKRLLVPSKTSLGAACSGHCWTSQGKTQPRALSLREMLISTQINWKNPKKPL
ncbi:hypothetical protein [Neptunicella marina]|uniref:Uncharacterized protein n=1 Tax=Neptunicella marina TaxID=2125989 RepID=A0A8J6IUL0_9ALTE|nr:hypothetical protein [Neptunicella marina]MBC3766202.1 hypothetical protein [Neptunicella marina]